MSSRAVFGIPVRNYRYRTENGISDVVASRDFKRMSDLEWLMPVGEKRGRTYVAGSKLAKLRAGARAGRRIADPYQLIADGDRPASPGAR